MIARARSYWAIVALLSVSSPVATKAQQPAASNSVADRMTSSPDGAIAGHVTDARLKPVDMYSVIVFPTDRTKWVPDARSVTVVRPAQDGGFEVVGLAPGEYWVVAVDAIPVSQNLSEWGKPEVLERLSTRATRVMLAARERYMTVLRLIRR